MSFGFIADLSPLPAKAPDQQDEQSRLDVTAAFWMA